jgi:ubiquinol-cytochrome c reductase cytochrome c1 subunit
MNVLIITLLCLLPSLTLASEVGYPLDKAPVDMANQASLQRGAKYFVNYCQGCHSLQYERYNRMGRDLGLSDDEVKKNLMFNPDAKVGETMKIGMPQKDAKKWFGAAPPDLSVIARSRGSDYVYTYLRTFYLDPKRPWGVNNAAFPAVGMPHVLWELQGWQEPVYKAAGEGEGAGHEGGGKEEISGFKVVKAGSMTPPEFDAAMADLVNFLTYVSEPMKLERQRIGVWVLAFLVLAFAVFYPLKKEYWKDVH